MNFTFSKKVNKVVSFVVIFLMTIIFVFNLSLNYTNAEEVRTGHIVNDNVNIRSGPGTGYSCTPSNPYVSSSINYEILGVEDGDDDGYHWYKIKISDSEIGYVREDLFVVNVIYTLDGDFEEYLSAQGFPDSYKDSLRVLHEEHPSWVFVAAQTGIDWETAVNAESNPSNLRKVVYPFQPESWRSCERYGYNLSTGSYVEKYDGGTFYAASREIVAYYMDPRNFFTTSNVFQFLQLSYNSTAQTKEGLQAMLDGTFMAGDLPESEKIKHDGKFKTYNDVIMTAAEESGVSPYEIASIILQEQGTSGQGGDITDSTEYFNFFNIGASGADAISKGLAYAKNHGWNSYYNSIVGGARWYYDEYISSGQDTKYFTNWNVNMGMSSLASYQYATYIGDTANKTEFLFESYENHLDYPLVFKIPVFKNMPSSKSPMPGSGNNINFLKTLTVDDFNLNASFDPYKYEYELVVDPSVDSITINATSYAGEISGLGEMAISGGAGTTKKFSIVVKASSGVKRTYYLTVAKANGGQKGPQYNPEDLKFGTYLTGVSENINYSSLIKMIKVPEGGTISVYDKSGNLVTSGKIGTGIKISVDNGNGNKQETIVVIRGDLNGDSAVNTGDLLAIRKHLVGITTLNSAYLEASDLNKDDKVDTGDLLFIRKVLVGLEKVKQ